MAIPFLTGQRLTADLLNTNLMEFFPSTTMKSGSTGRVNNTLTADPDLAGIPLSVGTWEIEAIIFYTITANGQQGLKTRWGFTGTWNGGTSRGCYGGGYIASTTAGDPRAQTVSAMASWTLDTQDAQYNTLQASSVRNVVREVSRNVIVTVAGTMSLNWAQINTNANATTIQPDSHINVRKIA